MSEPAGPGVDSRDARLVAEVVRRQLRSPHHDTGDPARREKAAGVCRPEPAGGAHSGARRLQLTGHAATGFSYRPSAAPLVGQARRSKRAMGGAPGASAGRKSRQGPGESVCPFTVPQGGILDIERKPEGGRRSLVRGRVVLPEGTVTRPESPGPINARMTGSGGATRPSGVPCPETSRGRWDDPLSRGAGGLVDLPQLSHYLLIHAPEPTALEDEPTH